MSLTTLSPVCPRPPCHLLQQDGCAPRVGLGHRGCHRPGTAIGLWALATLTGRVWSSMKSPSNAASPHIFSCRDLWGDTSLTTHVGPPGTPVSSHVQTSCSLGGCSYARGEEE